MTTKPARKITAALTSMPWAMTEDALRLMLAIAERTQHDPAAVEARKAERLDQTATAGVRDGVAVIPVIGPIARRMNMFTEVSGGTSLDLLARDFTSALNNSAVKAIALNIDSPGGEANGVSEFSNMVYSARGRKPIYAYVGGMGASAAYWIASAADRIVVDDTAMLGSIGVIAAVPTEAEEDEVTFVSSQSPNKRPDPTSEAGAASIQSTIDSLAQVFIESVARNRGVSAATVLSDFGQGGLFVGKDAVAAGLADHVGSFEGVVTQLAQTRLGVASTAVAAQASFLPSTSVPSYISASAAPLLSLSAPPASPLTQSEETRAPYNPVWGGSIDALPQITTPFATFDTAPPASVPTRDDTSTPIQPSQGVPPMSEPMEPAVMAAPTLPPISDPSVQARLDAYLAQTQAQMAQREREIEQRLTADFERRMLETEQRNAIHAFARRITMTSPDQPYAIPGTAEEHAQLLLETPPAVRGKWSALLTRITTAGLISFDEIGSSGEAGEAADRWSILLNAKVATGMSRVDAIKAVSKEHPDLYAAQSHAKRGGR